MSMRKSKTVTIGVAILFLLISDFGSVNAQLAGSPWPMLHGNLRHTGLSPYNTTHVNGTLKWSFETNDSVESSPAIGVDGTIYIGSHDGYLYAINPDGTLKWKFKAGYPIYDEWGQSNKSILASPAIASDGTIYFVALSNNFFALNPDGSEKWSYPVHVYFNLWTSPAIGPDGTIYIGSESYPPGQNVKQEFGGRLYALNPDGTLKWRYDTDSSGFGNPPAIGSDGTIYTSGGDWDQEKQAFTYAIFAFNPDGSVKWKFKPDAVVEGSPTIAEDGTIYVGTKNGKFYALNPDGSQKWIFQAGGGISALAAIGKDGTIYIGSWDGNFYALNPEGKELWRFDVKQGRDPKLFETQSGKETITSSAAIANEGTIYFGDGVDTFYALDLNGTEKWHYSTRGAGFSASPAIGKDGTVYIASVDHKVYAFGGSPKEKEDEQPKEVAVNNTKETEPPKKIPLGYIAIAVIALIVIGAVIILKKRGSKN